MWFRVISAFIILEHIVSIPSNSMQVSVGKRRLTDEERIQFEEEERHLKISRAYLEKRLAKVQEEVEAGRLQQVQLKQQVESIGNQIKSQTENRTRQLTLQLELNKSLSKTREAFMKCVTESMASGNLSQKEGLAYIVEETVNETLILDEMDRPHANHRCQALRRTCLDLRNFFPPTFSSDSDQAEDTENNNNFDPIMVLSTCPVYASQGRCQDQDCSHHQSGEPRIPPQLDPLPDLNPPAAFTDNNSNNDARKDEEDVSSSGLKVVVSTSENVVRAWWLGETEDLLIPDESLPLCLTSFLESVGLRESSERRLYLETAFGETLPGINIGRYVDGFRLALHAGVIGPPFDLEYMVKALGDLGFGHAVIERVKNVFEKSASFTDASYMDACGPNFQMQLELLRAVEVFETGTSAIGIGGGNVDEECIEKFIKAWEGRKKELSILNSSKRRRTEILKTLVPVGLGIVQALERAASQIRHGYVQNLANLCDRLDRALLALLQFTYEDTFLQLLLIPLFAGNTAFMCSLKMFHQAYSRLESLLCSRIENVQGVNLLAFSELLWSQVLQMRMCLPPIDMDSNRLSDYRMHLDTCIDDLDIRLRHIRPVVGRVK